MTHLTYNQTKEVFNRLGNAMSICKCPEDPFKDIPYIESGKRVLPLAVGSMGSSLTWEETTEGRAEKEAERLKEWKRESFDKHLKELKRDQKLYQSHDEALKSINWFWEKVDKDKEAERIFHKDFIKPMSHEEIIAKADKEVIEELGTYTPKSGGNFFERRAKLVHWKGSNKAIKEVKKDEKIIIGDFSNISWEVKLLSLIPWIALLIYQYFFE